MLLSKGLARMYYTDIHRRLDRLERKFAELWTQAQPVEIILVDNDVPIESWGPDGSYQEFDQQPDGHEWRADDYQQRTEELRAHREERSRAAFAQRRPEKPAEPQPPSVDVGWSQPGADPVLAVIQRNHNPPRRGPLLC